MKVGQVSDEVTHGFSHTQVPLAFVQVPELRKLGDGAMLLAGLSEFISARAAALGPFFAVVGATCFTAATCFGGTVVVATGVRRTTAGDLGGVGATVVGVTVLRVTTCAATWVEAGAVVEVTWATAWARSWLITA